MGTILQAKERALQQLKDSKWDDSRTYKEQIEHSAGLLCMGYFHPDEAEQLAEEHFENILRTEHKEFELAIYNAKTPRDLLIAYLECSPEEADHLLNDYPDPSEQNIVKSAPEIGAPLPVIASRGKGEWTEKTDRLNEQKEPQPDTKEADHRASEYFRKIGFQKRKKAVGPAIPGRTWQIGTVRCSVNDAGKLTMKRVVGKTPIPYFTPAEWREYKRLKAGGKPKNDDPITQPEQQEDQNMKTNEPDEAITKSRYDAAMAEFAHIESINLGSPGHQAAARKQGLDIDHMRLPAGTDITKMSPSEMRALASEQTRNAVANVTEQHSKLYRR